ncbi:MAG: hypothetical protein R3A44_42490 [Caldilineaceae bacterium]
MIWIRNRRFMAVALWGLLGVLAACRPLPSEPVRQVEVAAAEPTATAIKEAEFVPTLTDMRDMAALQADFNAYPDTPRLILLLSPT